MAAIGVIKSITGQAIVINERGERHILKVGETLQAGEEVVTGPGATVVVALINGKIVDLAEGQTVKLTENLAQVEVPDAGENAVNQATIQSVIQAIAEGRDVNEALDATAAGLNGTGGNSDGDATFVNLERIAIADPNANQYSSNGGSAPNVVDNNALNYIYRFSPSLTAELDPNSDSGIKGDSITNDNTPTIIGTGDRGSTITVTTPKETLTTIVDDNGKWSVTPTKPLDDGANIIGVKETDPAGNTLTTTVPVTVDTIAPSILTFQGIDDQGNTQGVIVDKSLIDDNEPEIKGVSVATPGDTITIYDGGNPIGTTIVNKDGTWSFTPSNPLPNGEHTITVTETDPAGNVSAPSSPLNFTIIKLYSTGVDDAGHKLSGDAQDSHYQVMTGTSGDSPKAEVGRGDDPNAWLADAASNDSAWVAPLKNAGASLDPSQDGHYTYTQTFDLSGVSQLDHLQITGRWAADNIGVMKLNGHVVDTIASQSPYDGTQFTTWHGFALPSQYLIAGQNTITWEVTNLAQTGYNPTGLRVEFNDVKVGTVLDAPVVTILTDVDSNHVITATEATEGSSAKVNIDLPQGAIAGDILTVTDNSGKGAGVQTFKLTVDDITAGKVTLDVPLANEDTTLVVNSTITHLGVLSATGSNNALVDLVNSGVLYSTGVDDSGQKLSGDAQDTHYTIKKIEGDQIDTTGHRSEVARQDTNGAWLSDSTSSHSAWVTPTHDGTQSLDAKTDGVYVYTQSFDLTNVNQPLAELKISGQWSADNYGVMKLNGVVVPEATLSGDSEGFKSWHHFTLPSENLLQGQNTLTWEVTNIANSGVNPTGLRVEFNGGDNTISNGIITGTSSNDSLIGTDNNDIIHGGDGNDIINAGAGNDIIVGGAGNDTLTGGIGSDVFKWNFADAGPAGAPAKDTITDFNAAPAAQGGDVLDVRDLLQGETKDNLQDYLHFEKSGSDTIVHISTTGGFAADTHTVSDTFSSTKETQQIVLSGVDLTAGHTSDAAIIANMMAQQKLVTD